VETQELLLLALVHIQVMAEAMAQDLLDHIAEEMELEVILEMVVQVELIVATLAVKHKALMDLVVAVLVAVEVMENAVAILVLDVPQVVVESAYMAKDLMVLHQAEVDLVDVVACIV